jgi:hypothetical protein
LTESACWRTIRQQALHKGTAAPGGAGRCTRGKQHRSRPEAARKGWIVLKRSAFVILCTVFALALTLPARAATSTTNVQRIQIDFVAGGCGEAIEITGSLLATDHVTDLGTGKFIATFHFSPQGATGLGLTSGELYHATGETRATMTLTAGSTFTYVNNFKLIGDGSTPNYLETDIMHITINAQGVTTVSIDRSTITCR